MHKVLDKKYDLFQSTKEYGTVDGYTDVYTETM